MKTDFVTSLVVLSLDAMAESVELVLVVWVIISSTMVVVGWRCGLWRGVRRCKFQKEVGR